MSGDISGLRLSNELKSKLDRVFEIANEKAIKEGLPPLVKNDMYRQLLGLGAEEWLNKKSKKG